MHARFSVAFVLACSLPVARRIIARAAVHVRVVSAVRSWAEAHFLFQPWAVVRAGVSQIDAGDRYLHSPEPAEQISQRAAVVPVVYALDPVVAAVGRDWVAVCSDLLEVVE